MVLRRAVIAGALLLGAPGCGEGEGEGGQDGTWYNACGETEARAGEACMQDGRQQCEPPRSAGFECRNGVWVKVTDEVDCSCAVIGFAGVDRAGRDRRSTRRLRA